MTENRLTPQEFNSLVSTSEYGAKYLQLIFSSKIDEEIQQKKHGCEIHHIIPRCYGGGNEQDNLIKLTTYGHILAHYYLALITNNIYMYTSFWMMINRAYPKTTCAEQIQLSELEYWAKVREESFKHHINEEGRKKISEKAKDRWKRFRESGRIDEVKNNISKTTKEGMKKSKHSQIRTRINLNSKWYYNETEDKEMHWYEGMEEPDPTLWRRGRRGNSKESREKLKKTLNARRKIFYHNDELKINTTFNEGDIIPPGWEIGSRPEYRGNNSKFSKIEKENKLNALKH